MRSELGRTREGGPRPARGGGGLPHGSAGVPHGLAPLTGPITTHTPIPTLRANLASRIARLFARTSAKILVSDFCRFALLPISRAVAYPPCGEGR